MSEAHPPVILFVGRLIPEKGVHVLIAAMRLLRAERVEAVARIIGSVNFGDSRGSTYVEDLRANAPDNVQFRPYMAGKALADEFRRASIFCCPSTWDEPFGMVNVGGDGVRPARGGDAHRRHSRDLFEGGAMLVERDSARELAEALKRLVLDAAARRRLAREGFASYRKRFRWSVIASKYQDLMTGCRRCLFRTSRRTTGANDLRPVVMTKRA